MRCWWWFYDVGWKGGDDCIGSGSNGDASDVVVPEYGGVEDLLDPLTVQTCLPTAPD